MSSTQTNEDIALKVSELRNVSWTKTDCFDLIRRLEDDIVFLSTGSVIAILKKHKIFELIKSILLETSRKMLRSLTSLPSFRNAQAAYQLCSAISECDATGTVCSCLLLEHKPIYTACKDFLRILSPFRSNYSEELKQPAAELTISILSFLRIAWNEARDPVLIYFVDTLPEIIQHCALTYSDQIHLLSLTALKRFTHALLSSAFDKHMELLYKHIISVPNFENKARFHNQIMSMSKTIGLRREHTHLMMKHNFLQNIARTMYKMEDPPTPLIRDIFEVIWDATNLDSLTRSMIIAREADEEGFNLINRHFKVLVLLKERDDSESYRTLRIGLSIITNCHIDFPDETAVLVRESDGIESLLSILQKSQHCEIQVAILDHLTRFLDDSEIEKMETPQSCLAFILEHIEQCLRTPDHEGTTPGAVKIPARNYLKLLQRLCISDKTARSLFHLKIVSLLEEVLKKPYHIEEIETAVVILWNIANLTGEDLSSIKECTQLQSALTYLSSPVTLSSVKTETSDLMMKARWRNVVTCAAREIIKEVFTKPMPSVLSSSSSLTYKSKAKPVVYILHCQNQGSIRARELADSLNAEGYDAVLSLARSSSFQLYSTIKEANALLLCISQEFCRNELCRNDTVIALKKHIPVIPIFLEEHIWEDPWVAMLFGSTTAFEPSDLPAIMCHLHQLLPPAVDYTKPYTQDSLILGKKEEESVTHHDSAKSHLVKNWNQERVESWIKEKNLTDMADQIGHLDGRQLYALARMAASAYEAFSLHFLIEKQCALNDILNLATCLEELLY